MRLLDILFPKRCIRCKAFGSYICPPCFALITFSDTTQCLVCNKNSIDGLTHPVCRSQYVIDGVFSSLAYKGIVKKLVHSFKYPPYITDIQSVLIDLFYEGIIQKELFYPLLAEKSLFIPIPLHPTRFRKRGYNQAQLLASGLGKRFDLLILSCLQRIKYTKTQVGLSKEERRENIKGAFALKSDSKEKITHYSHIFLIDDVTTSGATLREAARVLKQAGAKHVWGLTLAHGE